MSCIFSMETVNKESKLLSHPNLPRGLFGSSEGYSQIKNSSKWKINWFFRKHNCFFLNLVPKLSNYRSNSNLIQSVQDFFIFNISGCNQDFSQPLRKRNLRPMILVGHGQACPVQFKLSDTFQRCFCFILRHSQINFSSKWKIYKAINKSVVCLNSIYGNSSYRPKCPCPIE